MTGGNSPGAAEREIVITRMFDAPRELVWHAMTDPRHVVHWWGPRGFTTTIQQMDVRPGGVWQYVMHGPDGTDYPNQSTFKEVVKPERLVWNQGGGRKGEPTVQFDATWTFEAIDSDRTRVTIRMVFGSAADRNKVVEQYGAIEGGRQTLDRLAEHVPTMGVAVREVVITRTIKAPRTLVFQAWTDPRQVAMWWGPHGFTNPLCELDVRPGGTWRIVMCSAGGTEYPGNGVYLEVVEPERLVFTNIATDASGNVILDGLTTVTFAELGATTQLTVHTRMMALVASAVAMLAGMQAGWSQSLERFDETVAVAQKGRSRPAG